MSFGEIETIDFEEGIKKLDQMEEVLEGYYNIMKQKAIDFEDIDRSALREYNFEEYPDQIYLFEDVGDHDYYEDFYSASIGNFGLILYKKNDFLSYSLLYEKYHVTLEEETQYLIVTQNDEEGKFPKAVRGIMDGLCLITRLCSDSEETVSLIKQKMFDENVPD